MAQQRIKGHSVPKTFCVTVNCKGNLQYQSINQSNPIHSDNYMGWQIQKDDRLYGSYQTY